MEEKQTPKINYISSYLLLAITSIATIAIGYFLYSMSFVAIIRFSCFILFGQILVIFACNAGGCYFALIGDNIGHLNRFYIAFAISMLVCTLCPVMPVSAWPIVVFFVLLTILSNIPAGILAGSICLVVASCLGETVYFAYFIIYFLCGIMSALVIAHVAHDFKLGFPITIISLVLFTSLLVISITSGTVIGLDMFIYPIVNVAISLLLILLILKIYSSKVIFVQEDRYLVLNDPECQLLSQLKNTAPQEYFTTVHILYFCDRLSDKLGLDGNVLKCAGLYHRVGIIGGNKNWENTKAICVEQGLPEEVLEILRQLLDPSVPITSPEATVLYMSDSVVSSIQYLFNKNKDATLDYKKIIETVFKQRYDAGMFKGSSLTINQFEKMKKVFVEEKLYYDFLR